MNYIELRTGTPYANLIASQQLFAAAVGDYFDVSPDDCIPTTGTTGAIEAVRNHVFRTKLKACPTVLTVTPGYWRARESFEGLGFRTIDVHTEPLGFSITETLLVEKAEETEPDLLYLSLPNNPTGAIFDPEAVIAGVPEGTAVVIDLTLPSRVIDAKVLTRDLYRKFRGRNLFLVGSTSKSHGTAEYRIGWAVCANSDDAAQLKQENRNVVATASIKEAMKQLERGSIVIELIETSFTLLRNGEKQGGGFELVRPQSRTETGYVLVRVHADASELRSRLAQHGIRVMWGSEFGLSDQYIRLETLEPRNIDVFVETVATKKHKSHKMP